MLQQDFSEKKISKDTFKEGLKEMCALLKEVQFCLSHSEPRSFEEKVRQLSGKALNSCGDIVQFM